MIPSPQPASAARSTRHGIEIDILRAQAVGQFADAWADLAARSLELNIFFEPEFALPGLTHFGVGHRLRIVFAWNSAAEPRQLVGVLPVVLPRFSRGSCCRGWLHDQAVLGTPLVDRSCPSEALDAMIDAIGRSYPGLGVLLLPLIPKAGPTFALLQVSAGRRNHKLTLLDEHERAVLRAPYRDPLSSHAAGELRRQRRRLMESGSLAYRSRQDTSGVVGAMEDFLALEAHGWKGRRKSALASSPATAAFARDMARRMGRAGKLSIDSLELSGHPIAMGVILKSGGRAFFWKTAFDEAHAGRSPGVLFTQDLTQRQISDANIATTDSCAIPNHPMINRLWPGRLTLVTVAMPLHGSRLSVGIALLREKLRRRLRRGAKFLVDRMLRKSRL
jgi:CelD/BcsL family acetyltransferase involved in cellulose biosynthesis